MTLDIVCEVQRYNKQRPYLLSSTHHPQNGSCAPRHSPQLVYCEHSATFTFDNWEAPINM